MKSVEEALAEILAHARPLGAESVELWRALSRVLAEDVASPRDLPPFDNSEMDGYALRSADGASAGRSLRLRGEAAAGHPSASPLLEGTAQRIFTGAPLPEGADAVVKQEDVRVEDGRVLLSAPVRAGQFVRPRGSDLPAGATALRAGTVLGAGELGLAAALGRCYVQVRRAPTVAILSTGDELVEPDRPLGPGQIVNSNALAVAAQVAEAGGEPRRLGIARDEPADLEAKLRGAKDADVLLTIGGVSVGDRDYVKPVLADLGCELGFWRVNLKPGKPLLFGRWDRTLVFGLPGNPASSMVTFELFVRPALRALAGHGSLARPMLRARLSGELRKKDDRRHFLRARAFLDSEGRVVAEPLAHQGSGQLTSMLGVNALVVVSEETRALGPGDEVALMLVGELGVGPLPALERAPAEVEPRCC